MTMPRYDVRVVIVNHTRLGRRRWKMKFPKLFGDDTEINEPPKDERVDADCPHLVLVPRWDSVDDMGDESKASGYRCYACGVSMSLEEARQLKERHAIAL